MAILLDPQRPLAYGSPHATVQPYTSDLLPFSQHSSSGNYFNTTETSSPAIMLALAQVGSPMGEGQGPPSPQSFQLAGRHKGTRVQACLGHLGHRGTSPGDLGDSRSSRERQPWRFWVTPPIRFRRGLITLSHPSEGGNKLLHLKTKRGAGGGWSGYCTQLMARTARLLRGKRCTLMCLERWSLRANFFSHTGHWYGFTPE